MGMIDVEIEGMGKVASFPRGISQEAIDKYIQSKYFSNVEPVVPTAAPTHGQPAVAPAPAPAPRVNPALYDPVRMFGNVVEQAQAKPGQRQQYVEQYQQQQKDREGARKGMAEVLYPFVKPLRGAGMSLFKGLNEGMKNFSQGMDFVADYLAEQTGTTKGGVFKNAAQVYEANEEYWKKRAKEDGVGAVTEFLNEAVGGAVPGIAEFMLGVPWYGAKGAAEAKKKGNNQVVGALKGAMERGLMGKIMHTAAALNLPLRSATSGVLFEEQARSQGADPEARKKAAITGFMFGAPGRRGGVGIRDLAQETYNIEREALAKVKNERGGTLDLENGILPKAVEKLKEERGSTGGIPSEEAQAKLKEVVEGAKERGEEVPLYAEKGFVKATRVDGKVYPLQEGHRTYEGIPGLENAKEIEDGYVNGETGEFTTRKETVWGKEEKKDNGTTLGFGLGDVPENFRSMWGKLGKLRYNNSLTPKPEGVEEWADTLPPLDNAKFRFGTTTNIHSTGFILPNGEGLDFGASLKAGGRIAHENIDQVYKKGDGTGVQSAVKDGAVRVQEDSRGNLYLETSKPITPDQVKYIKDNVLKDGRIISIYVDHLNNRGEYSVVADKVQVTGDNAAQVFNRVNERIGNSGRPKDTTLGMGLGAADPILRGLDRWLSPTKEKLAKQGEPKAPAEEWIKRVAAWGEKHPSVKDENMWNGLTAWLESRRGEKTVEKKDIMEFLELSKGKWAVREQPYGEINKKEVKRGMRELDRKMAREGITDQDMEEYGRMYDSLDQHREPDPWADRNVPGGIPGTAKVWTLRVPPKQLSNKESIELADLMHRQVELWDTRRKLEKEGKIEESNRLSDEIVMIMNRSKEIRGSKEQYNSSHFPDKPNVVVHFRTQEIADSTGEKGLLIETIQSDWHQERGAKGNVDTELEEWVHMDKYGEADERFDSEWYEETLDSLMDRYGIYGDNIGSQLKQKLESQVKGLPPAPFERTWAEVGLKHALDIAAQDPSIKWVGWSSGKVQNERWGKGEYVGDQTITDIQDEAQERLIDEFEQREGRPPTDEEWEDIILPGIDKEVSARTSGSFLETLYDKRLPKFAKKYAGKLGGKYRDDTLSFTEKVYNKGGLSRQEFEERMKLYPPEEEQYPIHRIDLTDSLRSHINTRGQEFYQMTGPVAGAVAQAAMGEGEDKKKKKSRRELAKEAFERRKRK